MVALLSLSQYIDAQTGGVTTNETKTTNYDFRCLNDNEDEYIIAATNLYGGMKKMQLQQQRQQQRTNKHKKQKKEVRFALSSSFRTVEQIHLIPNRMDYSRQEVRDMHMMTQDHERIRKEIVSLLKKCRVPRTVDCEDYQEEKKEEYELYDDNDDDDFSLSSKTTENNKASTIMEDSMRGLECFEKKYRSAKIHRTKTAIQLVLRRQEQLKQKEQEEYYDDDSSINSSSTSSSTGFKNSILDDELWLEHIYRPYSTEASEIAYQVACQDEQAIPSSTPQNQVMIRH